MSNIIDKEENMGTDNLRPAAIKVKPAIPNPSPETAQPTITSADVVRMSQELQSKIAQEANANMYDPNALGQVIAKENLKIKTDIDYSKLTVDDIYNLNIPIQAKPFGSEDSLKVELKDKNYEARWVNKSPRRLGQMLSYGFTYVEPKDLAKRWK
jgi:hypothetical protein